MRLLAIETSCDETGAAVVDETGVLAERVWTQDVHAAYGGVMPEEAAREHVVRLPDLVAKVLAEAGEDLDGVAVTVGPGLVGALLVGASFASTFAAARSLPVLGVHHVAAHALAVGLESDAPEFPYVALCVSGGHTSLFHVHGPRNLELLGETVDDAVGEAFDKVARMLGLGWPGGPAVDGLAEAGNPAAVAFPRPRPGMLDFSFAGLKTAVRQHLQRPDRASDADVAASFQEAVADVLTARLDAAVVATGVRGAAVGGGVAANRVLRRRLAERPYPVCVPPPARCTDNAGMIGWAAIQAYGAGAGASADVGVRPQWAVEGWA